MPRGPITAGQALTALLAGLALGAATGYIMRSRWAMLLAPLIVALAFELRWVWLDGPTVDLPRFDTSYGILAIILGRGFFFLVCTVPMLAGCRDRRCPRASTIRLCSVGAPKEQGRAQFPAHGHRPGGRRASPQWCSSSLAPARRRRSPTPTVTSSLAASPTLEKVPLPGGDQWISIRGYSQDNPVLLYLHGGPGQSGMPFTRFIYSDIAKDFVVVDWDQRGNGKSLPALDPTSTYTLDGIVEDAAGLSRYLAQRFDERKIYLAGTSWG